MRQKRRSRRITASMSDAQLYRELKDVFRYMDKQDKEYIFREYIKTPYGSKSGRTLWRYGTEKAERQLIDDIIQYIMNTGNDFMLEDIGNVLNEYYDDDDIYSSVRVVASKSRRRRAIRSSRAVMADNKSTSSGVRYSLYNQNSYGKPAGSLLTRKGWSQFIGEDDLRRMGVSDDDIDEITEEFKKKYRIKSNARKIPYNLVSSFVVLRDYANLDDNYVSEEHRLLTDIADSLYHVGGSAARGFAGEYRELYDEYGKAYFDKVLDDIYALDSQISRDNVEDLVADVNDLLRGY